MKTTPQSRYQKTPKGIATQARWNRSPKGKASQARYRQTPKRKAASDRYCKADGTDRPGYWRIRENTWAKWGITDASEETYRRMYKAQGGKCFLCDRPHPLVGDGERQSLHLDHNHSTGLSRALLCRRCNFRLVGKMEGTLGRWGVTEEMFRRALAYILNWHSQGGRE